MAAAAAALYWLSSIRYFRGRAVSLHLGTSTFYFTSGAQPTTMASLSMLTVQQKTEMNETRK